MVIENWDEARHGISAYEMVQSGNYLINTYRNNLDYMNAKPPLSFWHIVIGFKVFGFSVFGFRVMSAVCAALTVLMVVLYAGKRFAWSTGLLAGAMLITAYGFVLFHHARSGDADAPYILLTTGAVIAVLESRKYRWLLYFSCFLLSLAFLTKAFHAAAPFLVVFGLALWILGKELFHPRTFLLCALWVSTPVLVWAAARYTVDGTAFFNQMLFYDVLNRATNAIEGHGKSAMFYFSLLKRDFGTMVILLASGFGVLLLAVVKRGLSIRLLLTPRLALNSADELQTKSRSTQTLLGQLLFSVAVPVVMFQMSVSKLSWYLYPVYPFIAILLAVGINTVWDALTEAYTNKRIVAAMFAVLALVFVYQETRIMRKIYRNMREQRHIQLTLRDLGSRTQGNALYLEQGGWEQRDVMAAKLFGHFIPMDGGREAWEKDNSGKAMLLNSEGKWINSGE